MIGQNLWKKYNFKENDTQKYTILIIVLIINLITKWYHSFGVKSITYASGDAYGVMSRSMTLEITKDGYGLLAYIFRIIHEITNLQYSNMTFIISPILSTVLLISIYIILSKYFDILVAGIACFLIAINPWISMYSTDVSKELFVFMYFTISLLFLLKYEDKNEDRYIFTSFALFALGTLMYHSLLLYLPIYILIYIYIIYRSSQGNFKDQYLKIMKYGAIFMLLFLIIATPFYAYRIYTENLEKKQKTDTNTATESTTYGNLFERQIGAMIAAVTQDHDKLGYFALKTGFFQYLLNQKAFIFLFILGGIIAFLIKNRHFNYFFLILIWIFFIISIQWTSSSHGSRYPQYLIYLFFIIISITIVSIIKMMDGIYYKIGITIISLILLFIIMQPFYYVEGLRHIYVPQMEAGDILKNNNITIDNQHTLLFLGWPAISVSIMESYNLKNESYFHTFGWGNTNLANISSKSYIIEHNISYYIYDHTGTDYFNSSEIVLKNLNKEFNLTSVGKSDRNDLYIQVYKIER